MTSFNLGIVASAFVPLPVVTGGDFGADGTYYYRTFLSSGDLVISNSSLAIEAMLWGGGGGGSYNIYEPYYSGGHGGGGGYYNIISATLTVGTYPVAVGAGGAPSPFPYSSSFNGINSYILSANSGYGGGESGNTINAANSTVYSRGNPYYLDTAYGGPGGAGAGSHGSPGNYSGYGASGGFGAAPAGWGIFTRGMGGKGGPGAYGDPAYGAPDNPPPSYTGGQNFAQGGDGGTRWFSDQYGNNNYDPRNGGSGLVTVRYLRSAVGG